MTAAEHTAQRDRVTGSLLADEQKAHRHDAPARPGHPSYCRGCGRRWGSFPSDRSLTGESCWEGDQCASCAWDQACSAAAEKRSR